MSGLMHSQEIGEADFSGVLQTLSATAKGRAFLSEYLRRYRPTETRNLLAALQRIEATVRILRDQLQPERLGSEMRRIADTLDIAVEDVRSDASAEAARRSALLARASADLVALAESVSGQSRGDGETDQASPAIAHGQHAPHRHKAAETIEDDLAFLE